jgi:hypothetical protein
MSCHICSGSGWRVIERGGASGAERCECCKSAEAAQRRTPITNENATALTKILFEGLSFAPRSEVVRAAMSLDLKEMCGTLEALTYVVETSLKLHTKWPGLPGLRQVLTNRYKAADGIAFGGFSDEYPEGIGDALSGVPELPALPALPAATEDRELAAWRRSMATKRLDALPALPRGPQREPIVPPLPANPITAEDIEREIRRQREGHVMGTQPGDRMDEQPAAREIHSRPSLRQWASRLIGVGHAAVSVLRAAAQRLASPTPERALHRKARRAE